LLQVIVVHPEVVVHPVDEEPTNNNDEPLKNEAEYFVRYFSEDHKIWNDAYHFWIHDHMFESSDECCVRNDVVHMELDLNSCMDQNTARTYDPSCEPSVYHMTMSTMTMKAAPPNGYVLSRMRTGKKPRRGDRSGFVTR
jgi:hypothetical protein